MSQPRSIVRYALGEVAVGAALINAVINAAVGWALYHPASQVPLSGSESIVGDTIVGALLIGFFTWLLVVPAAQREARSGRVCATERIASGWLGRRRVVASLLFALALAVAAGGSSLCALWGLGVTELSLASFLAFKIGFATVVGGSAAAVAAFAALSPAAATPDARWCREPGAELFYPCDYIDKGGIAVSSATHGCSATPTWQLVVSGTLDPKSVRAALTDVLERYPSLRCRVQALDALPAYAKRYRYAAVETTVEDIFDVLEAHGATELNDIIAEHHSRHLDLFTQPPMTVTMVITGEASCRLLFRQHHAIADGRAFIELLGDFARYVDAHQRGVAIAPDALAPVHRRPEAEALQLGGVTRLRYTVAGYLWLTRAILRALIRPVRPSVQNRSNDYTGQNGSVHWSIDDAAIEAWKPARTELGVSLNSMLTGALFLATRRWHDEMGEEVGRTAATLIMETRPRDGSFRSFANHLATLEVSVPLQRHDTLAPIAQSIHRQVKHMATTALPIKRLLCEQSLVARMPMDKLRAFVFESKRASYNLNFSNLIALPVDELGGAGWRVEEILITTPVTPRAGIVVTVIRYGGRVTFNFNYSEPAVSRDLAAAYLAHFRAVLAEATGYDPVTRRAPHS